MMAKRYLQPQCSKDRNTFVSDHRCRIQLSVRFIVLIVFVCFSTTLINCDGGGSDSSSAVLPEVTNLTVEKVGNKLVTLSWENPPDDNLEKIRITYSGSAEPIDIEKDLKTADIIVPLNSVKYSFTVKTVSKTGKESEGVCIGAAGAGKLTYKKSALHQMGDEHGNNILSPPKFEGYHVYEYNVEGDLISEIVYYSDDSIRSEIDYFYNTDRTIFEKKRDHKIDSLYWYDQEGNRTEWEWYRYSDEIDNYSYKYE